MENKKEEILDWLKKLKRVPTSRFTGLLNLDYKYVKKLLKELVGGRILIRAVAYVVKSETALGEKEFFKALEEAGLELRVKDLQTFSSGAKKADWDVGMAIDAVRISSTLDVVIIVTGDGDFIPLVEYLKWGLGKQVEVGAFF